MNMFTLNGQMLGMVVKATLVYRAHSHFNGYFAWIVLAAYAGCTWILKLVLNFPLIPFDTFN